MARDGYHCDGTKTHNHAQAMTEGGEGWGGSGAVVGLNKRREESGHSENFAIVLQLVFSLGNKSRSRFVLCFEVQIKVSCKTMVNSGVTSSELVHLDELRGGAPTRFLTSAFAPPVSNAGGPCWLLRGASCFCSAAAASCAHGVAVPLPEPLLQGLPRCQPSPLLRNMACLSFRQGARRRFSKLSQPVCLQ